METVEINLVWISIFAYACSFCIHSFSFGHRNPKGIGTAVRLYWFVLAPHLAAIILRWISAGHSPVTDTYELNLTCTFITILMFLGFLKSGHVHHSIGLAVFPVVFLLLGNALVAHDHALPMGPAYRSPWLAIHVIFAWISFGCFAIAMGAGALLLLRDRLMRKNPSLQIPSADSLDLTGYRMVAIGFINHAVMLVSGSIWAKSLWGHYWSWDALESWNLLTFLLYAFYLHARRFLGWKMKRAAWLAALGLVVLSISYWGVSWFAPTIHPGP